MADLEWDKDENGHVLICLYDGHQTATISDRKILLRLEYLAGPGSREETLRALQVALSRDQARELGQVRSS